MCELLSRTGDWLTKAIAICMLVVLAGCGSVEERAKAHYQRGAELLKEKNYAKAAVEFRNALQLNENHADAWFGMAQIEESNKNWPTVAGDLNKVLEINPKHEQARIALAKFLLLAGDFAGALKHANVAYEDRPRSSEIAALRAAILLKLNDTPAAVQEANKALAIDPTSAEAIMVLAAVRLEARDNAGALELLNRGLKLNEAAIGLQLFKIKILENQGDVAGQESVIKKLLSLAPEESAYRRALVSLYVQHHRHEDAVKELRSIAAAKPDDVEANLDVVRFLHTFRGPEAASEELSKRIKAGGNVFAYQQALAQLQFNQGRSAEAISLLKEVIATEGMSENGLRARLDLASLLIASRRSKEAEGLIGEVLGQDSRNTQGLKLRAAIAVQNGQLENGIMDLREALSNEPKDIELLQSIAYAYERTGAIDLASKELAEAVRASNFSARPGLVYARFLLRRGKLETAEDLLIELASRSPQDTDVLATLGEVKLRRRDWQGAEDVGEAIRKISGNRSLSSQILGAALEGQQKFAESIELYRHAYSTSPTEAQPMFRLVRAYLKAGRMAEAEQFLGSVLKANPQDASARILLGAVQLAKDQPQLAEEAFKAAVKDHPDNAAGYRALAHLYLRRGETDRAIATLRTGIEKLPARMELRLLLASALERAGDIKNAIKEYESLLKQNPDSIVAVNNLVALLSDYSTAPADLERAATMASILRDSPIPEFRDTLGWALYRKGESKSAVAILEKSTAELPNLPTAHYHLGMAYARIGEREKAADHLRKALDLGGTSTERTKTNAALGELAATQAQ